MPSRSQASSRSGGACGDSDVGVEQQSRGDRFGGEKVQSPPAVEGAHDGYEAAEADEADLRGQGVQPGLDAPLTFPGELGERA